MAILKEEKEFFRSYFDQIQDNQNYFKKIIYALYVNNGYSYCNIVTITRHNYKNVDINDIIEVLKEYNVKRCSKNNDCKSPNGCIQSRENFSNRENSNDGKKSTCKYCKNFNQNFKYANSIKQNYMLEFQKLELDRQDEFLINLYRKGYDYRELSVISLRSTKYVINLLEKNDIKKCSKCGIIQSRSNFVKNINSVDKLNNQCQICKNKYHLENKEHKSEYDKIYYSININKRLEYHKRYRTQFGKYDIFASQLEPYGEEIRRDSNNSELIQVRCKNNNCNKWFNPTNRQIRDRVAAINGNYTTGTECNFYCNQTCKDSCSLYNMKASELMLYDKLKNGTLTEIEFNRIQQEIRSLLINIRNPDYCNYCREPFDVKDLILHHIIPVSDVHIFEADPDNLIFVCKDCHNEIHQKDGCKTGQLRKYLMEDKLC